MKSEGIFIGVFILLMMGLLLSPHPARGHSEYPIEGWTKIMVLDGSKFMLCRPALPQDSVKTTHVCTILPAGALILIPHGIKPKLPGQFQKAGMQ